jgi:hypothetical protein
LKKFVIENSGAIVMSAVASQDLFSLNQELMTLSATDPSTSATVQCFRFKRRPIRRAQSTPVPRLAAVKTQATASASPAHFSILSEVISAAFPDFDFSTVNPWNFKRINAPEQANASISWAFQNTLPDCDQVLPRLWATLDKEIALQAAAIYAYESDRPDAFSESGAVFNLCYFFLNEKTERAAVVHLCEGGNDLESDDEDLFDQPTVTFGYAVV